MSHPAALLGKASVWVWLCAGIFVGLLIFVGGRYHHAAAVETAELDAYFLRADELLHGQPYRDLYRPPLYTVLTALTSVALGVSTFRAATLVSAVAAGAILVVMYQIARLFLGLPYTLLLLLLLGLEQLIVLHGLIASTDALFTVLTLALLLAALMLIRQQRSSGALVLGVGAAFGLAYSTRYTAVALVMVVLYACLAQPHAWRRRAACLGLVLLSALVCAAPWLVYNTLVNGSPFYNENWRNFAFAVYGQNDFTYLRNTTYTGYGDVFWRDPAAVVRLWVSNIRATVWAIPFSHSSSLLLALFLPVGGLVSARSQAGRLLYIYILACIAPTVLSFTYNARLLLPATPVIILIAIIGMQRVVAIYRAANTGEQRAALKRRLGAALFIVQLAAIVVLPARKLHSEGAYFLSSQPLAEIRALDALAAQTHASPTNKLRVVSTYRFLSYFAQQPELFQHEWVPSYSAQFPGLLVDSARSTQASYILVSDLTAGNAVRRGIVQVAQPSCWRVVSASIAARGTILLYQNGCR